VTAEQQQDGAAADILAFLDAWEADRGFGNAIRGGNGDIPYLFATDLRAVLTERNALAARVAELEGEREADTRAVARVEAADTIDFSEGAFAKWSEANEDLFARFADRIAAQAAERPEEACAAMPDTHDDGSGGAEAAMLTAIRRRALTASTYAEWHQVGRDIETLGQKLANATARAEKAEAYARSLTGAVQAAADFSDAMKRVRELPGPDLSAVAAANSAFVAAAADRIAALAADASQGGLSATQTDAEGPQASPEGSNSSTSPERPQEPEPCDGDCDCDCQPGQPCLCPVRDCYCGPCRVCGDNPQQADDDTTEGR
jgi:hypothetical protein